MTWHKNDPVMSALVLKLPKLKSFAPRDDIYLALLDSVMGQQLSIKAADTIFGRFLDLFPKRYPDAKKLLKMPDEKLRSAGLSAGKTQYAKNIAAAHLEHPMTQARFAHLKDDEIIAELTQIKGVGLWTVQMLLMFAMGRRDVFSPGDLVVRQVMVEHYELQETGRELMTRLHEIAESWRPQRTLGCRYLWSARAAAKAAAAEVKTSAAVKTKAKASKTKTIKKP